MHSRTFVLLAFPAALAPFALLGACATPPDDPIGPADLERELAQRESRMLAESQASGADFWRSCARAHAPAVRAARRELAALTARRDALGAPAPSMLEASHIQNGGTRETELMLALDLPGLVGAGRAGAMTARADAEIALARERLASAEWNAIVDVERARANLAAARERAAALDALLGLARADEVRLDLLAAHGWLPPNDVAAARAMLHHAEAMRTGVATDVAQRRSALAAAAGLAPDAAALDGPD